MNSQLIRPEKLPKEAAIRLAEEIWEVDKKVFVSPNKDLFIKKLTGSSAPENWLQVYRNELGAVVGYSLLLVEPLNYKGKKIIVLTSRSGMLRKYRGRNTTPIFGISRAIQIKCRHPFRKVYNFTLLGHPSSFLIFSKWVPGMFPYPIRELPPKKLELVYHVSDLLGLQPIEGKSPLIRQGSGHVQTTPVEQLYWEQLDKPPVQYFLALNPEYYLGQFIVSFFEIDTGTVSALVFRLIRHIIRAKYTALFGGLFSAFQLLFISQASQIRRLLRQNLHSLSLPLEILEFVAQKASVLKLKRGELLFQKGAPGDSAYLVAEGTLYVYYNDPEEGEVILDQAVCGDLIGEMALLSGASRSASVRAIKSAVVIRFSKEVLEEGMRLHPDTAMVVWQTYALRVGSDLMQKQPAFQGMERPERTALIRDKKVEQWQSGETRPFNFASYALLLRGSAQLDDKQAEQAPVLLNIKPGMTLSAIDPSMFVFFSIPPKTK